jgi:hypothetical protein
MNHYKINNHTDECLKNKERFIEACKQKDNHWIAAIDACISINHFLFFMDNDFHLVSYYDCRQGYRNHLDFKELLLKSFCDNKKLSYDVKRSYEFDKEMKNHRLRSASLNLNLEEIVYYYYDNANKMYCMCRDKHYSDFDNDLMNQNLKKTIEYLNKNGYEYMVNEAERLAAFNILNVDPVEEFKTIDHVIKSINKQIKSKQL